MLIACALALLATVGGAVTTYLYDARATLGTRLAAGYCLGTTFLGFVGYALASRLGMTAPSLALAVLVTLSPLFLLRRPDVLAATRSDLRKAVRLSGRLSPRRMLFVSVFTFTALLLIWVFRGTMYVENGAIYTNNHNNLGDLPFHLAIVQGFVVGDNFPPQHPEFAGARLTYPFLVDFMAAQFVQAGATLSQALFLQNVAVALALLTLLYRWAVLLTRRAGAALLTPLLLIFSGGLGFTFAWGDWKGSGRSLIEFLSQLPHDYTVDAERGLRWGNTMTALWTTQRGFLLALPLALIVWTLWYQEEQQRRQRGEPRGFSPRLIAAGIVTGMTPLVHGHTFLMLLLTGGVFALWDVFRTPARWRSWAAFFLLALALALPQALLLTSSTAAHGAKFFGWQPGWDIDWSRDTLLRFWWRNLGVFWPLLFLGLCWPGSRSTSPTPSRLGWFYGPFTLCFLLPLFFRFAPWIWDNIKILFYWYVVSSLVVANTLVQMWRQRRARGVWRLVAVAGFVLLTLAGSLDVLRIGRGESRSALFPAEAQAFALAVEKTVPRHAVLLHSPRYDHPLLLTGRPLVMGYEGHLWSHGLDYAARKEDVKRLYAGDRSAPSLLKWYGIDYVCVGPDEKTDGEYRVNEPYWARFPLAVQTGPYRLYRVSGSVGNAPAAVAAP